MQFFGELLVPLEVGFGRFDAGLVGWAEGLGDALDLYLHLGDLLRREGGNVSTSEKVTCANEPNERSRRAYIVHSATRSLTEPAEHKHKRENKDAPSLAHPYLRNRLT